MLNALYTWGMASKYFKTTPKRVFITIAITLLAIVCGLYALLIYSKKQTIEKRDRDRAQHFERVQQEKQDAAKR